jgi:hypothetical protein
VKTIFISDLLTHSPCFDRFWIIAGRYVSNGETNDTRSDIYSSCENKLMGFSSSSKKRLKLKKIYFT